MSWSGGTYTRTNGVYSGATVWFQDYSNAVKIVYDRHDYHDEDLAQGINACLNKNGENSPTVNISWGGFKITDLAIGSASTDSARTGQTITALAINPSTKILTATRADGDVTVDLTPIVVAGDTSDFARLSLGNTFALTNTFSSATVFSSTWDIGTTSNGYRCTRFPAQTPVSYGLAFAGLGYATTVEFGFGLDGSSVPQAYISGVRLLREGDVEIVSTSADETITGNWEFTGSVTFSGLSIQTGQTHVMAGNGYSWSVTIPAPTQMQWVSSAGYNMVLQSDVTTTTGSKLRIGNGAYAWHTENLSVIAAAPTGGNDGQVAIVNTGADMGVWVKVSGSWVKIAS